MLAEIPAVIAPEHDDGVIPQSQAVKLGYHSAYLRVGATDAGVVAVHESAG